MKTNADRLRDRATGPTLARVRADRELVSELLKPVFDTIEARLFDRQLNAAGLCQNCVRSQAVVEAHFARELGTTPLAYLTECRMEIGVALLLDTDLMVFQIAETLGYPSSRGTFSEAFGRWCGQTPADYRRNAGAGHTRPAVGLASAADVASRTETIQSLSAELGIASHRRGAEMLWRGELDRAYEDLTRAKCCYASSELPPKLRRLRREIPVNSETDQALLSALCPDCRGRLAGEEGVAVREYLRHALYLVPRDLPWFASCCDDCYRVVWKTFGLARLGLMNDAWQAWWLAAHADLGDREIPPSRGRIIAAFAKIEELVSGDQAERKGYCDLALSDAVALGDPRLEAEARIWMGTTLRGLARLEDAREELQRTASATRDMPWLKALRIAIMGMLEFQASNYLEALDLLRSAGKIYRPLDPHNAGIQLIHQGGAHFYLEEYAESIRAFQSALSLIDGRRDPVVATCAAPLNLSSAYALLRRPDKAEEELAKCHFDRDAHPGWAATECFNRGAIELLRDRLHSALASLAEAAERFEELHKPLDAVLAVFYSVEAHARLGDRASAIEKTTVALTFFQAAGCTQDAVEALGKLRNLLKEEVMDVARVTAAVRRLARQHAGGWLPETE